MSKSIIDKFIVLQAQNGIKGFYFKELDLNNGDVHCKYSKITPEQAKNAIVIARYDGLDAVIAFWDYQFNQMPIDFQHLIKTVFPYIKTADKLTLKPPFELLSLATAKAKMYVSKTCPFCQGQGWRYYGGSQLCPECHGGGKILPQITPQLLKELSQKLEGGAQC